MNPAYGHRDFSHNECLQVFEKCWREFPLDFPVEAKVLEIGCAEDDWQTPMLQQRPDLQIMGIDWRPCQRPGTILRGDVLTTNLPMRHFDAVVLISALEHIGLGHYDGDPLDPDGDTHCMQGIAQWLKPGGWVYADVPGGPAYTVRGTEYRVYDEAALWERLIVPGLTLKTLVHTETGFPYVAFQAVKA